MTTPLALKPLFGSAEGAFVGALPDGRVHPVTKFRNSTTLKAGPVDVPGVLYHTLATAPCASAFVRSKALSASNSGVGGHVLMGADDASLPADWEANFLGGQSSLTDAQAQVKLTTWSNATYRKNTPAASLDAARTSTSVDFNRGAVLLQLSLDPAVNPNHTTRFPGISTYALRLTFDSSAQTNKLSAGAPDFAKPQFVKVLGLGSRSLLPPTIIVPEPSGLPTIFDRLCSYYVVDQDENSKAVVKARAKMTDPEAKTVTTLNRADLRARAVFRAPGSTAARVYVYDEASGLVYEWGRFKTPVNLALIAKGTALFDAFGRWDLMTYPREVSANTNTTLAGNTVLPITWVAAGSTELSKMEFLKTGPETAEQSVWVAEVLIDRTSMTPLCSAFIVDFNVDSEGVPLTTSAAVHVPHVHLVETPRTDATETSEIHIHKEEDTDHPHHGAVQFLDRTRGEETYAWSKNTSGEYTRATIAARELKWRALKDQPVDKDDDTLGVESVIDQRVAPKMWASTLIEGEVRARTEEAANPDRAVLEHQSRRVYEIVAGTLSAADDKFYEWGKGPKSKDAATVKEVPRTTVFTLGVDENFPLILTLKPGFSPIYKPVTADADYINSLSQDNKAKLRENLVQAALSKVMGGRKPQETDVVYRERLLKEAATNPYPAPLVGGASNAQVAVWDKAMDAWQKKSDEVAVENATSGQFQVSDPKNLTKVNWGHQYVAKHPITRKLETVGGNPVRLTNYTGLAYDADGYPKMLRMRNVHTLTDGNGEQPQPTSSSGAFKSHERDNQFAACLAKPDTNGERTKQYQASLRAAGQSITPKCKFTQEYDVNNLKVEVDSFLANVKYEEEGTPYVSKVNQTGCEAVNYVAVSNVVELNKSTCNIDIRSNTISNSAVAVANITIGEIAVSGSCCPNMTINNNVTQTVTTQQNIANNRSVSTIDHLMVKNATDFKSANFSSKDTEVTGKGDKAVSGATAIALASLLPQPGGKNLQNTFNSTANNSNFMQFVEDSAAVSTSEVDEATIKLDKFTCSANPVVLKQWVYIPSDVEGKGEFKQQDVPAPCGSASRDVSISNQLNQRLDISQFAMSTSAYIAQTHTDLQSDTKGSQKNVDVVKVRADLESFEKSAGAGIVGGWLLLVVLFTVLAYFRLQNMFKSALMNQTTYEAWHLDKVNAKYSFSLQPKPVGYEPSQEYWDAATKRSEQEAKTRGAAFQTNAITKQGTPAYQSRPQYGSSNGAGAELPSGVLPAMVGPAASTPDGPQEVARGPLDQQQQQVQQQQQFQQQPQQQQQLQQQPQQQQQFQQQPQRYQQFQPQLNQQQQQYQQYEQQEPRLAQHTDIEFENTPATLEQIDKHRVSYNLTNPNAKIGTGWRNRILRDSLPRSAQFKLTNGLGKLIVLGNGTVSLSVYISAMVFCALVLGCAVISIMIRDWLDPGINVPFLQTLLSLPAMLFSFVAVFVLGIILFGQLRTNLTKIFPGVLFSIIIPVSAIVIYLSAAVEFLLNGGTSFTFMYFTAVYCGVMILGTPVAAWWLGRANRKAIHTTNSYMSIGGLSAADQNVVTPS